MRTIVWYKICAGFTQWKDFTSNVDAADWVSAMKDATKNDEKIFRVVRIEQMEW